MLGSSGNACLGVHARSLGSRAASHGCLARCPSCLREISLLSVGRDLENAGRDSLVSMESMV